VTRPRESAAAISSAAALTGAPRRRSPKRHSTGQGKARCASWRQAPASAAPARTRSAGASAVSYRSTGASPFLRPSAAQRSAACRPVTSGLPGINRDYLTQGCRPASADAIVCANALHGSRDANYVLRNLKELLAPGGWLIFTETCRDLYDIMASAEFLMSPPADDPGLDFEDFRRGTGRIFITRQEWLSLLARAGFGGITCLPGPDSPPAWFGQYVFAARNSR
jgi:pyochelin synthetase